MTQLNNAAGDGGLTVGVSSTGAFGSNTGVTGASDAQYNPIGTQGVGNTTFQSDLAFRIGQNGARQFISNAATNIVAISSNATTSSSSFIISNLKFELIQVVDDLKKDGQRTGSSLSQTYKITNPTSQAISFELVRYFDGDLLFDGSLLDKGGKINRNGQDILFETDSGDNASAPTTFVGITAKGGTELSSSRFEIGEYSSLRSNILAGNALQNIIKGDTNGDSFIDSSAFDVTPAFRNVFELAPGQSTTYVTETIFGSGAPNQVVLPQTVGVVATDANAAENPLDPGVFTFTRTNADLTKPLTVQYTLSGTATNGTDYTNLANSVTFAVGKDTATLTVAPIDDNIFEGTESVVLKIATDPNYNPAADNNQAQINIADNETATTPTTPTTSTNPLTQLTGNILQIGTSGTSVLKFTKTTHEATGKSEVCAFVVDDAQGRIGNIAPGNPGYLAAALDRSQVIFSTLSDRANDNNFERDSQRNLQFNAGDRLEFCLISDDTIDSVKANLAANKPTAKVLFSLAEANIDKSNQSKFTALANNGGYQIAWEDIPDNASSKSDKDFNDFVFKIENLDKGTLTAGSSLQSKSEGQVIDLRGLSQATVKVDTLTVSDAAYNNYIGFYAVEDAQGTLANGLKPTDIGYAEAAIKSALLRSSKNETQSDLTVATGKILAPVVIANGTFENFLASNPTNQANSNIHAYFNYIGANTDKVDHFRLLGDNKFGVEDIFGGGDRNYNDIIFQMNVKG